MKSIMIVRTTIEERGSITQEEIEMLERAKKLPVVFDEDSPELAEEDLKGFRRVSNEDLDIEKKLKEGEIEAESTDVRYSSKEVLDAMGLEIERSMEGVV